MYKKTDKKTTTQLIYTKDRNGYQTKYIKLI